MKKFFITTFLFIAFHSLAEVKLEDCATIKSDVKRLACYDYILTGVSKSSEELVKKEKKINFFIRCLPQNVKLF